MRAIKEQGEYSSYGITAITFPPIAQVLYRIQYVPRINAHLRVGKEDYSGPTATIISQQGDKIVDLGSYGDNLYGLINRVGNQELVIEKVHKTAESMYQLGDYTDENYVLTSREIAVYNDLIRAKYDFTKNYNAFSTKIGIDRRKQFITSRRSISNRTLSSRNISLQASRYVQLRPCNRSIYGRFLQQTYLPPTLLLSKRTGKAAKATGLSSRQPVLREQLSQFTSRSWTTIPPGCRLVIRCSAAKVIESVCERVRRIQRIEIRLLNDAGKYPANNDRKSPNCYRKPSSIITLVFNHISVDSDVTRTHGPFIYHMFRHHVSGSANHYHRAGTCRKLLTHQDCIISYGK